MATEGINLQLHPRRFAKGYHKTGCFGTHSAGISTLLISSMLNFSKAHLSAIGMLAHDTLNLSERVLIRRLVDRVKEVFLQLGTIKSKSPQQRIHQL